MRHKPIRQCCPPTLTQERCLPCAYPVLAVVSNCYPSLMGRLLMFYSPVRHSKPEGFSFDLHVLGTPPAFILSQDQTLHLIFLSLLFLISSDIFSLLELTLCVLSISYSVFKDHHSRECFLILPHSFPLVNPFFFLFFTLFSSFLFPLSSLLFWHRFHLSLPFFLSFFTSFFFLVAL